MPELFLRRNNIETVLLPQQAKVPACIVSIIYLQRLLASDAGIDFTGSLQITW